MNIKLWQFSKKDNSTKRPVGGISISGTARNSDAFSMYNPTIIFDNGLTNAPTYNYCYIEDFGRYYYITDWRHDRGLWAASLKCDVMATYKDTIGATELYILRSAAEYDTAVRDTKYPIKAWSDGRHINGPSQLTIHNSGNVSGDVLDPWHTSITDGVYYVGIYGPNETGVTWYSMYYVGFRAFVDALCNYTPSPVTDIDDEILKRMANPMQYIARVLWAPFPVFGKLPAVSPTVLYFGNYPISIPACAAFDPQADIARCTFSMSFPGHPWQNTRGKYLNLSPYSRYSLEWYPFGVFELDSVAMFGPLQYVQQDEAVVICEMTYDYTTGKAVLRISSNGKILHNVSATLGIPISLTQSTVDYIGHAAGIAQAAGGIVDMGFAISKGGLTGAGFAASAGNIVGGFANAMTALQPVLSTMSGGGDFTAWAPISQPRGRAQYAYIADEDNTRLGRPLCKVRTPASLGGYMQAENAKIEIPGTLAETQEIEATINGGFYYE